MSVFDYIEKELDRIEVGYTSYDGTKITLTMDEVRELVQNIKKKYKADGDIIYRSDAIETQKRIMADHPLDGYEDGLLLINALNDLPSAKPDTIPVEWIQRYADDWEDMNYPYDNPILEMLEEWRGE